MGNPKKSHLISLIFLFRFLFFISIQFRLDYIQQNSVKIFSVNINQYLILIKTMDLPDKASYINSKKKKLNVLISL